MGGAWGVHLILAAARRGGRGPSSSRPSIAHRSRSALNKEWIGRRSLAAGTRSLVLGGHRDFPGHGGSGTPGEAVDIHGAAPMNPAIRDELHGTY